MSAAAVTAADLRFINLVATRNFGGGREPAVAGDLEAALASVAGEKPHVRAASLAAAVLSQRVFTVEPLTTALLAMACQLDADGLQLLAPQGAIVGMMRELAAGQVDVDTVSRWLEDRAVPGASSSLE